LADHHADGAPDEKSPPTEPLDCIESYWSHDAVDQVADDLSDERVLDGFEVAEEDGAVVEDEVYAGPLLEHLECGAKVVINEEVMQLRYIETAYPRMVRLTLDLAEKTDPEKQCVQEASQLPAGMTLSS